MPPRRSRLVSAMPHATSSTPPSLIASRLCRTTQQPPRDHIPGWKWSARSSGCSGRWWVAGAASGQPAAAAGAARADRPAGTPNLALAVSPWLGHCADDAGAALSHAVPVEPTGPVPVGPPSVRPASPPVEAVSEPSSAGLFLGGVAGLLLIRSATRWTRPDAAGSAGGGEPGPRQPHLIGRRPVL